MRSSSTTAEGTGGTGDIIQSAGFAAAVGICVIVGFVLVASTSGTSRSHGSFEIEDAINPNDASPSSLARLPGIGLGRARAIVSYRRQVADRRDRALVFRCPEDLQAVSGIGPATTGAAAPWLSFDPSITDGPSPLPAP